MDRAPTALQTDSKEEPAQDSKTDSRVVMIADSDNHVRQLLSRFLTEAGYTVTFEIDGYKALDSARLSPPAAVLADVLLPRLDGLALCRLLKSDPVTQNVATIVFSVLAAEERAEKAGADGFIRKPLEKTRLLTIMAEAIKKKKNGAT